MLELENEQWKDVIGYEGLYRVSTKGNIFGIKKGRNKRYYISKTGYPSVNLTRSGLDQKTYTIHSLMALAFIDRDYLSKRLVVNHLDGNKANNRLSNLEVTTHSVNSIHAFDIGLNKNFGGNHCCAKISNEEVVEIKGLISKGYKDYEIAKITESDVKRIGEIRRGKKFNRVVLK